MGRSDGDAETLVSVGVFCKFLTRYYNVDLLSLKRTIVFRFFPLLKPHYALVTVSSGERGRWDQVRFGDIRRQISGCSQSV